MIEIKGKYNEAKVFTDVVDELSLEQIQTLCDQEFTKGSKIRLMPDVHAGKGCTIGTTMTLTDRVVPNLVGVDIGCGMETVELEEKEIDFKTLDALIYKKIPSGFSIRETEHKLNEEIDLTELFCAPFVDLERARKSLGSLGSGNHFIEVDKDEEGHLYIVIHSGSRHLGTEVATYYQEMAYKKLLGSVHEEVEALIARLKEEGLKKEIQSRVTEFLAARNIHISKDLAYLEGELFDAYIHDMKIVQRFALLNRKAMMDEILQGMNLHVRDTFTTIHNYIDTEAMILRKGAVSAKKGEKLLIPINMKDGSLICIGKGNPDWNESAPHGAGRLYSRKDAKERFTLEAFQEVMQGVYTTSVHKKTLDECPMAYKGMEDIVKNIADTAEISKIIRPVYNFKA